MDRVWEKEVQTVLQIVISFIKLCHQVKERRSPDIPFPR